MASIKLMQIIYSTGNKHSSMSVVQKDIHADLNHFSLKAGNMLGSNIGSLFSWFLYGHLKYRVVPVYRNCHRTFLAFVSPSAHFAWRLAMLQTINHHSLKRLLALTTIMLESPLMVTQHAQHQRAFLLLSFKVFIYSSRMTLIGECPAVIWRRTTNNNKFFENFLRRTL